MIKAVKFLKGHKLMVSAHIMAINVLLGNRHLRSIANEYSKQRHSPVELPFNVFKLISKRYYLERFHSEIIVAFLDPTGKHKEGNMFLNAFIDFLNRDFKTSIFKTDYTSAKVIEEFDDGFGKIDILIKSDDSKHCIIIENKIHNAGDTDRQLPRYYDTMTCLGFNIDAIIYIPLNEHKRPDQKTWNADDRKHVIPLLHIVPAYSPTRNNLVEGWIVHCSQLTANIDCISILRQYGDLIKSLNYNTMNNFILEKFHKTLLEDDNYETALSVKEMLSDMPIYMADRLCEIFRKENMQSCEVWKWKPQFCGLLFRKNDLQYKIDIWTSEKGYDIYVFGQGSEGRFLDWAENMDALKTHNLTKDGDKEYKRHFDFRQESEVVDCARDIAMGIHEYLTH